MGKPYIAMSNEATLKFEQATCGYLCKQQSTTPNYKVRGNCHLMIREAIKTNQQIGDREINVIPNSDEKCMSA